MSTKRWMVVTYRWTENAIAASPINEHAAVEEREAELRHQEAALVKLGELYRDQRCVLECG